MSSDNDADAVGDAAALIERLKEAVNVKTDAELAALLKVSRPTISNWRGRNSVPLAKVKHLCGKFAVPVDYIVTGRLGVNKYIRAPMDVELLGYIFTVLARYGFIALPESADPEYAARRAAAEFVELQRSTLDLMQTLTVDRKLGQDEAKKALLSGGMAPYNWKAGSAGGSDQGAQ